MSCDTHIVCVYDATCSVVEMLVVSVDVEKDGGQDTTLPCDKPIFCFLHLLRSFSSTYNLLLVGCLELCC